jgi:hypothetical protein
VFEVRRSNRWRCALGTAVLAAFLGGCAGYHLGPSNGLAAREQSVYVEPFVNDTIQPRLEDDITRAIRSGLQREGTYRVGHKRDSDIIVQGVIKTYSRRGLAYDPGDLVTVRDYDLVAVAHVTALERGTGRKVLDQDVAGHTQIRANDDLLSAERQAIPLLADNLAKQVVDLLADGTW